MFKGKNTEKLESTLLKKHTTYLLSPSTDSKGPKTNFSFILTPFRKIFI